MAQGRIVRVERDDTYAYAWIGVAGDWSSDAGVVTEYAGMTPLRKPDGSLKNFAELRVDLIASCKATRDRLRGQKTLLPITGDVDV